MIIDNVKIFKYALGLKRPIHVKGQDVLKREGLIIQLDCAGYAGFGEIAPLPNFSEETLEEALEQMISLKDFLLAEPIPEKVEKLDGGFHKWLGELSLYHSVQFGLEMAVLNLIANIQNKTLCELLSETNHSKIPINALVQGTKDEILKQAQDLVSAGFHSIKVKVGSDIDEDIKKIQELYKAIEGQALIHLDANQSWTLNEAIKFSEEVGLAAVDYIEEPFKDIKEIPEFVHKTTIPVALDESLLKIPFDEIKSIDGVDVLVLKPTLLGGIERTWLILAEAKRLALSTVISSMFESSIGILTLANIAGCSFRNNPAGLDTTKWFKEDLLVDKLSITKGKLDIEKRQVGLDDVQFENLQIVVP